MPTTFPDRTYWNATADGPEFPRLSGDLETDVVIVGGGIVGITTARFLKDRGVRVVVLEARRVGRQVTGKSTAKLSSQHGLKYHTLEKKFGEAHARRYGEAQEMAIRTIRDFVARHRIECDLEDKSAYIYARDEDDVSRLQDEFEAAQRLGLPASLVHETDLPYEVRAALRFDGQAQFHPVKYVAGLAHSLPDDGCQVFEQSRVIDWTPTRVTTAHGSVSARHVVMATHLPLGQIGLYYARAHAQAEPVIAAPLGRAPEGMFINAGKPSHSLRTHRGADGVVYGIAAGNAFTPGHTDDERQAFADLVRWLKDHFDPGPIAYRWVNEDYNSMDEAPFIGWSGPSIGERYLIATGFGAWGISNGTVAGLLIADLASDQDNAYADVFDAGRVKPIAGGAEFLKENLDVAGHLAGGYLARRPKSFDELAAGDAAILKIDGKRVAAFRDEQGTVHAVSAACTHMGCVVGWNETDRTWDCPWHGSRFTLSGEVLHGPATEPLEPQSSG